jgi:hypothetical protein
MKFNGEAKWRSWTEVSWVFSSRLIRYSSQSLLVCRDEQIAFWQKSREIFRTGLNKLFMTRPGDLPQVAEALKDLGWTRADPIFGHTVLLTYIVCNQERLLMSSFWLRRKSVKSPAASRTQRLRRLGSNFKNFSVRFEMRFWS